MTTRRSPGRLATSCNARGVRAKAHAAGGLRHGLADESRLRAGACRVIAPPALRAWTRPRVGRAQRRMNLGEEPCEVRRNAER
jgi:hypothetical protein